MPARMVTFVIEGPFGPEDNARIGIFVADGKRLLSQFFPGKVCLTDVQLPDPDLGAHDNPEEPCVNRNSAPGAVRTGSRQVRPTPEEVIGAADYLA